MKLNYSQGHCERSKKEWCIDCDVLIFFFKSGSIILSDGAKELSASVRHLWGSFSLVFQYVKLKASSVLLLKSMCSFHCQWKSNGLPLKSQFWYIKKRTRNEKTNFCWTQLLQLVALLPCRKATGCGLSESSLYILPLSVWVLWVLQLPPVAHIPECAVSWPTYRKATAVRLMLLQNHVESCSDISLVEIQIDLIFEE